MSNGPTTTAPPPPVDYNVVTYRNLAYIANPTTTTTTTTTHQPFIYSHIGIPWDSGKSTLEIHNPYIHSQPNVVFINPSAYFDLAPRLFNQYNWVDVYAAMSNAFIQSTTTTTTTSTTTTTTQTTLPPTRSITHYTPVY